MTYICSGLLAVHCNSLLFVCQFVPWVFGLLAVPACTMTARRTNNSLAASLDEENLSSDLVPHAEFLAGPSSLASAANSAPQTSSVVSAPVVAAGCCCCGRVWLAYDQAFRQHAAATKLIDWSTMNAQLYNFHAAGASVRSGSGGSLSELPEPAGADSSQVICRSWNRGRCSAQFASCRFAHRCSICAGPHRASECSRRFDKTPSQDRKRRSASPPPVPVSTSKTRMRFVVLLIVYLPSVHLDCL